MYLLDSIVPLKPDEKHCPYCMGFGGLPVNRNDIRETIVKGFKTCLVCNGSGKDK